MTVTEFSALAAVGLNIAIALVGGTWGISKLKDAIRAEMKKHLDKVDDEMDELRKESIERDATMRQHVGEIGAALRAKITEVELFSRDTFMRRDSFYKAMEGHGADVRSGFERIEKRLERMETKIDKNDA